METSPLRRAWITGSGGFAGRHLVTELEGRKVECVGIERRPGSSTAAKGRRLDLSDAEAVLAGLREDRPDTIFHLAAQSSGALSFERPGETLSNNLGATLGILEALRALKAAEEPVPWLLSVGSCEEYGPPASPNELPLREEQPLRPANPYAVSKAAQSLLCLQYRGSFGLPLLVVRSFTHTGPGQDDRFVFSSWAKQLVQAEGRDGGILRTGNLDVSRDLSDVREIVRAYADLAEHRPAMGLLNVCSGKEFPLRQGLEFLRAAATVQVEVELDPDRLRPSDVPRFVGDPTRLKEVLGWLPGENIETTLRDLMEDWRVRLGHPDSRSNKEQN